MKLWSSVTKLPVRQVKIWLWKGALQSEEKLKTMLMFFPFICYSYQLFSWTCLFCVCLHNNFPRGTQISQQTGFGWFEGCPALMPCLTCTVRITSLAKQNTGLVVKYIITQLKLRLNLDMITNCWCVCSARHVSAAFLILHPCFFNLQ